MSSPTITAKPEHTEHLLGAGRAATHSDIGLNHRRTETFVVIGTNKMVRQLAPWQKIAVTITKYIFPIYFLITLPCLAYRESQGIDLSLVSLTAEDENQVDKVIGLLRERYSDTFEPNLLKDEATNLLKVRRYFLNNGQQNVLYRLKKTSPWLGSRFVHNTVNVVNGRTIISLTSKRDNEGFKPGGGFKTVKNVIHIDGSDKVTKMVELRLQSNYRTNPHEIAGFVRENNAARHLPTTGFTKTGEMFMRAENKSLGVRFGTDRSLLVEAYDGDLYDYPAVLRKMNAHGTEEQRLAVTVDILLQLTNALNNLHKLGYVHRDIKPHNILYRIKTVDGQPKIEVAFTDFGFTTRASNKCNGGTRNYMSPERRAKPNGRTGRRAISDDIYSLGVTAFDFTRAVNLVDNSCLNTVIALMLNKEKNLHMTEKQIQRQQFVNAIFNQHPLNQSRERHLALNLAIPGLQSLSEPTGSTKPTSAHGSRSRAHSSHGARRPSATHKRGYHHRQRHRIPTIAEV